jgi:hypothetical protein
MRRREFITLASGWMVTGPLAARAQQPAMPAVGSVHSASLGSIVTVVEPGNFPIKASSNGRYLVNSLGQPFLMMAESAQAIQNILPADAQAYFADRGNRGYNGIQFDLVSTPYVFNNNPGYGFSDGLKPFAGALVTTPNEAYFERMDQYVNYCAQYGMLAILNRYEAHDGINAHDGSVEGDLVAAGESACTTYGQYLGRRYKIFPNVMWHLGNDYTPANQTAFNVIANIANGIMVEDTNHLMTVELDAPWSTSLDSTRYGTFSMMTLNGVYTYGGTYGECMVGYNNSSTTFAGKAGTNKTSTPCPSVMIEASYEFENVPGGAGNGGTSVNLRRQSYSLMLSGMSGQIVGNGYITWFETSGGRNIYYTTGVGGATGSWKNNLGSPGTLDLMRWKAFFQSIPWYNLLPDQTHVVGTAGYGTPSIMKPVNTDSFVPVAATPDGHLAVAYFSQGNAQSLTVAMTTFAGPVTAQWFDPTNGAYKTISGSPFSNIGTRLFSPTGSNGAGDPDRILVLTA